jgi:hypothetical protein
MPARAKIVFDDENRYGIVPWNDYGTDHAWLGEYHVIAALAPQAEAVSFKNPYQLLIRNGAKLL